MRPIRLGVQMDDRPVHKFECSDWVLLDDKFAWSMTNKVKDMISKGYQPHGDLKIQGTGNNMTFFQVMKKPWRKK